MIGPGPWSGPIISGVHNGFLTGRGGEDLGDPTPAVTWLRGS